MKTRPFEDENVARCRAARRRLERRCKTFEGLCAYLAKLEEGPWPTPRIQRILAKAKLQPIHASSAPIAKMRYGKAAAPKKAKLTGTSGGPATRKAVHKA